jgi:hypothetical protein
VQPHPAKWWARTAQLCVLIAPPGPSGGFMSPPVLQTPAEKAVPSASPLPLGFQASHQHALEATAAEGRKDSQVEKQPGLPPTHQQPLRTPAAVPGAGHRRLWWTHAIPAGARCSRRGAGSQYYSLEAGTETLPTGGRASSCQSPGSDAALPGHSRERRCEQDCARGGRTRALNLRRAGRRGAGPAARGRAGPGRGGVEGAGGPRTRLSRYLCLGFGWLETRRTCGGWGHRRRGPRSLREQ